MIPIWIIDELRHREEEERRREERKQERLELPLTPSPSSIPNLEKPNSSGGPIVIDLWPE